ncbi:MAG: hypothetical protein CL914_14340, partial [Deltaproteobacteria bacterium]|nr:hypothetical protein [Deltaproteobacteria bacterium]
MDLQPNANAQDLLDALVAKYPSKKEELPTKAEPKESQRQAKRRKESSAKAVQMFNNRMERVQNEVTKTNV